MGITVAPPAEGWWEVHSVDACAYKVLDASSLHITYSYQNSALLEYSELIISGLVVISKIFSFSRGLCCFP